MKSSSLYIHIPFCKKKCDYCDFYSVPNAACEDLLNEYISALVKEVAFYSNFYSISQWNTVYVGGGTPSLLSHIQLENLFSGIKKAAPFSENCEVTVEMNPDDVREAFIDSCKKIGVNRLSLGIQALDDKALDSVKRGCSKASALAALEYLDKNWNQRLSVDFIAGLPNHTYSSFKKQFEKIFEFKRIDHISLYTLTIEENTPLAKKIDDGKISFSYEKADKLWLMGRNILEKNGFMHYEISNFAKSGFESRHNTTYWKLESYIGCGAGASGTWYEKHKAERWTNTLSISAYNSFWKGDINSELIPRNIEKLDSKTLKFEFLMMGFRRCAGVTASDFYNKFGTALENYENCDGQKFSEIFSKWEKLKLAKSENSERFFLNRRGILLLNRFLEELL